MKLFEDWTTKVAIEFIQKHEPPEGYFLGFSGGKDSTVLYDLTKKSKVKFQAYYSSVGIDPPELVVFIKRNYKDVVFLRPKTSFYKALEMKGYPTKFNRWCCDYLKKNPTKDIPLNHRLMGIRAEESVKRRNRPKIDKLGKWAIYKPIFDWLDWEIWEYIEKNKLPYSRLYDEGFDRLGCVVCPFICGSKKLEVHKNRWPKIYKAFEHSMKNFYERKVVIEKPEYFGEAKCFEDVLKNWYDAKKN